MGALGGKNTEAVSGPGTALRAIHASLHLTPQLPGRQVPRAGSRHGHLHLPDHEMHSHLFVLFTFFRRCFVVSIIQVFHLLNHNADILEHLSTDFEDWL